MNHSQPGVVRVATEGSAFPQREFEACRSLQKGRSLDGLCTLDGRSMRPQREKMRGWVGGVVDGDVAADAQRGQAARGSGERTTSAGSLRNLR